jgi:hypothetical protein
MIVTMITEDSSITVDGDRLTVPVAAELGEWAVQFDGESAEVEYSDNRPNEVINATTFYARYQSDIDAHAAERLALNEAAALASIPTTAQLIAQLTAERKLQEQQGVTVNDIRYAGDPSNRQAIAEAMQFMADSGTTEFPIWKDSDDVFHANHPLTDVVDAYRAIGVRRVQLIAAEGQYAVQVQDGTMTDVTGLTWPQ